MVSKNNEVEGKDTKDANSREEPVLVEAEDRNRQPRNGVFHKEEVDVSVVNERIHEGVNLLGPLI